MGTFFSITWGGGYCFAYTNRTGQRVLGHAFEPEARRLLGDTSGNTSFLYLCNSELCNDPTKEPCRPMTSLQPSPSTVPSASASAVPRGPPVHGHAARRPPRRRRVVLRRLQRDLWPGHLAGGDLCGLVFGAWRQGVRRLHPAQRRRRPRPAWYTALLDMDNARQVLSMLADGSELSAYITDLVMCETDLCNSAPCGGAHLCCPAPRARVQHRAPPAPCRPRRPRLRL